VPPPVGCRLLRRNFGSLSRGNVDRFRVWQHPLPKIATHSRVRAFTLLWNSGGGHHVTKAERRRLNPQLLIAAVAAPAKTAACCRQVVQQLPHTVRLLFDESLCTTPLHFDSSSATLPTTSVGLTASGPLRRLFAAHH
jgi:hypothetical protein